MISRKTKYGLNALIFLAKSQPDKAVLISELAEQESIPKKFLEHILLELKKHGILQSKKGKGGGYLLGKPAREIYLGTVIRILEGPLAPVACVSQTAYQKCDECKDEKSCGIHLIMKDVRQAMADILDNTSLQDIIQRVNDQVSEQRFNYVI